MIFICIKFLKFLFKKKILKPFIKEIKADLIAKKWTEDDIDKISFICFDEKGNWKPKQDFSEEWGFIFKNNF